MEEAQGEETAKGAGVSAETLAKMAEGMDESVKKGLEKMFGTPVGEQAAGKETTAEVALPDEDTTFQNVEVKVKAMGTAQKREFETRNDGCYKGKGYYLPASKGWTWVVQTDNRGSQVLMQIQPKG